MSTKTYETISKVKLTAVLDDDAMFILCKDLTPAAHRQVRLYLKERLEL